MMLDGACDDVLTLVAVGKRRSLDCPVVRFRAAAREIDLLVFGIQRTCHAASRECYGFSVSFRDIIQ